MGALRFFNIKNIKNKFKLNILVETGTYRGDSIKFAKQFKFDKIISVEYFDSYFKTTKKIFKNDNNILLYNGTSLDMLPNMLSNINSEDRILFWLDAHLPSNYSHKLESESIEFPLENELNKIKEIRNISNDYFLIDDLRIYEDGPFAHGNWIDRKKFKANNGIEFIYKLFKNTHNINKDYRNEGYIVMEPRNV